MHYSCLDLEALLAIKLNCEEKNAELWTKALQENLKNQICRLHFRSQWKKQIEKGHKKALQVELDGLNEDLNVLGDWVRDNLPEKSTEKNFWEFFQDAILESFFCYSHSKGKAWLLCRNLLFFLCSALLPVVAAIVLQFAMPDNVTSLALAGLILAGCTVFILVFFFAYTKWYELCADRETWVRRSVCYGRLRLALSRFVVSSQGKKDYQTLISATFEILQGNYDVFIQNLSADGAAKDSCKVSQGKGAS